MMARRTGCASTTAQMTVALFEQKDNAASFSRPSFEHAPLVWQSPADDVEERPHPRGVPEIAMRHNPEFRRQF
jgi:hypothetical protein